MRDTSLVRVLRSGAANVSYKNHFIEEVKRVKKQKCVSIKFNLKSIFVFLIVTLSIVGLVSPVFSESGGSSGNNYFVLKAGVYTPVSSDLKDLGFGASFNGEVAFGHYFNKYFATEIGLGYLQSSGSLSGTYSSGSDSYSGTIKTDLWVIPVTLALKAVLPLNQFELYALGGAGAYFANGKLDVNGSVTTGGSKSSGASSVSGSATAFGGFLGCGANFNINNNWYVGAEGKYLWVKPSFSFYGTDLKPDMSGWIVTGNVGYKF